MEARVEMTLYVLNSSGDRRVDLLHWRFLLGVTSGRNDSRHKTTASGC